MDLRTQRILICSGFGDTQVTLIISTEHKLMKLSSSLLIVTVWCTIQFFLTVCMMHYTSHVDYLYDALHRS